jgi:hypothetical protein
MRTPATREDTLTNVDGGFEDDAPSLEHPLELVGRCPGCDHENRHGIVAPVCG